MSNYVEQTLTSGEKVLLETRIALVRYWLNFLIGGFFILTGLIGAMFAGKMGLINIILGALFIAPPIIRYFTNELALTNKRVVAKSGLISVRTIEMHLEKIESLRVDQGIFGRMLGYGTVVVVGTGGSREPIPNIPDPITFRVNFGAALEALKSNAAGVAA